MRTLVPGNFEATDDSLRPANVLSILAQRYSLASQQGSGIGLLSAGFTLLELLVVLAIVGIVASAVSMSVAPNEQRRMMHEVDRLAALFRLAHDETRVSGQQIEWNADVSGYRFIVDGSVRGEGALDDPLRPRAWPFPVESIIAPVIVFGREPLLSPAEIRVESKIRVLTLRLDEFGMISVVR